MRVDDLVHSLHRLRELPDKEKRQEIEQVGFSIFFAFFFSATLKLFCASV